MKLIYRVVEEKCYDPQEIFFEREEDARKYMENRVSDHLQEREDLFVSVDLPRHLHLRFGDPDGDSGVYVMFDMDEIVVH